MTDHVLVTGGAGYIGSHTAKALSRAGYMPVTVDNLSRGHAWAVKWGPLEQADLGDKEALRAIFRRWQPKAVLHFAAHAYVGESVSDPFLYYRNNVAGTLSLLEAMREAGCDKIVFSSTCATYGTPDRNPITEDTPQQPVNPYGASKLMVERILGDADHAYGLRSVILRYFNASGADPEGEIGEAHDPETHLIPLALEAAAGTGPGLKVFGKDYDTPDGTCIRDYIHVADLASAHVAALDRLRAGSGSCQINLGNGNGFSVLEVIRTIESVTGRKVPFEFAPRRPGDPPVLVADAQRASDLLKWQPQYAALDDQVRHAWQWLRRQSADAA
jgi:UDP-arabinose 4-epimerase